MRATNRANLAIVVLMTGFGLILSRQWQTTQTLRSAVDVAREQARERSRLLEQKRSLLALQPEPGELDRLRADRAAIKRLAAQVEQARRYTTELVHVESTEVTPPLIPVSAWTNVGRATPSAALQTILWASVRGDRTLLAQVFALDPAAETSAASWWEQLSPTDREKLGSLNSLVANGLTADISTVSFMSIMSEQPLDADRVLVKARVENQQHQGKTENFEFRRVGDEWRVVIPARAMARYQASATPGM
jgi:hypothetical protein